MLLELKFVVSCICMHAADGLIVSDMQIGDVLLLVEVCC